MSEECSVQVYTLIFECQPTLNTSGAPLEYRMGFPVHPSLGTPIYYTRGDEPHTAARVRHGRPRADPLPG